MKDLGSTKEKGKIIKAAAITNFASRLIRSSDKANPHIFHTCLSSLKPLMVESVKLRWSHAPLRSWLLRV